MKVDERRLEGKKFLSGRKCRGREEESRGGEY